MRKAYKDWLYIVTLIALPLVAMPLMSLDLFAGTTITLYPNHGAQVTHTFENPANLKTFQLPTGTRPESIRLVADRNTVWQYQDNSTYDQFLRAAIGQQVLVGQGGRSTRYTLLGIEGQRLILRSENNDIVIKNLDETDMIIPAAGAPAVSPQISVQSGGNVSAVSYFLPSMQSHVRHTGIYNEKTDKLTLLTSAMAINQSDTTFNNAKIILHIGEPMIAFAQPPQPAMKLQTYARAMDASAESAQAALSAAGEQYQYELAGLHNIPKAAHVNIPFGESWVFSVEQQFLYRPTTYFIPFQAGQVKKKDHPSVILRFKNTVNKPLPAGLVSLFDQNERFLGNANLLDTPEGEEAELTYGKAFDILAEKIQVEAEQRGAHERVERYTITLSNRKSEAVSVDVIDTVNAPEWNITKSNYKYEKISSNEIKFRVPIPAKSSKTVDYTVRISYR